MTSQRIVLVHRYFVPDTPPYATILARTAGALAASGYDVKVLTCQPSYNRRVVARAARHEVADGVEIVRWPVLDDRRSSLLKLLNLVWFAMCLLTARRHFRGASAVMCATTPPVVLAAVCRLVAQRVGARFVYHKQDIYPEVIGTASGVVGQLVRRVLRAVDANTDRRADRIVVLSDDMARTTADRGADPGSIVVLNNFDPWTVDDPEPPIERDAESEREHPGDLCLVFAGNLGRFQGLENLVRLIEITEDPRIDWHIFGDGPLRPSFDELSARRSRVHVHGYQPATEVGEFVRRRADLGIVCLKPGVIRAAYPSKTMTYLRHGCPILALIEMDSELGRMIQGERIGLVGRQDDVAEVASKLRSLLENREPLQGARARARREYATRFEAERQLAHWTSLFNDLLR